MKVMIKAPRRSPRTALAAVAALALGLCVVSSAPAQEPGVTYDPSSPAGKEYAVPLDQTRDALGAQPGPVSAADGSGGDGGERSAADGRELFGEGIQPAKAAPSPGAGKGDGASSGAPAAPVVTKSAAPVPRVVAESGTSGLAVGVGTAAIVLLLGAVAASALRRGQRRARPVGS